MKILVTGSSGHLGEALIRLLREKGIERRDGVHDSTLREWLN